MVVEGGGGMGASGSNCPNEFRRALLYKTKKVIKLKGPRNFVIEMSGSARSKAGSAKGSGGGCTRMYSLARYHQYPASRGHP